MKYIDKDSPISGLTPFAMAIVLGAIVLGSLLAA